MSNSCQSQPIQTQPNSWSFNVLEKVIRAAGKIYPRDRLASRVRISDSHRIKMPKQRLVVQSLKLSVRQGQSSGRFVGMGVNALATSQAVVKNSTMIRISGVPSDRAEFHAVETRRLRDSAPPTTQVLLPQRLVKLTILLTADKASCWSDNCYDDPNRTQDIKLRAATKRFWVDHFVIRRFYAVGWR